MLDSDSGEKFTLSGELLARVTKEVAFAVMDPRGAYYLTGVSWRTNGKKLCFTATDTHRLSTLSVDIDTELDIIVPPFDAPSWEGEVHVTATELFIRFQSGNQVVASKLIEAKYPEIDRLFPSSPLAVLIDREEFLAAVKRAGLVSTSVLIVGRDGVAYFSASSAGQDAYDEVAYEGADFQIAFPVGRLLSVLASFDCEVIRFGFVSHDATSVITDPRDDARAVLAFPVSDFRIVEYLPRAAAE
jgi:DNA polymerase-3 subunit beta